MSNFSVKENVTKDANSSPTGTERTCNATGDGSNGPMAGSPEIKLARKISGWTSNLLATAIVLVVMLVVGRQLTQWWVGGSFDGKKLTAETRESAVDWAVVDRVSLEFGDLPVQMHRIEMPVTGDAVGDAQRLRNQREFLVQECVKLLSRKATTEPREQDSNEINTGLRNRLALMKPIQRRTGHWVVYSVRKADQPGPATVLGLLEDDSGQPHSMAVVGMTVAISERRPVETSGSILTPNPTIYLFESTNNRSAHAAIPLPPGSRQTLSVKNRELEKLVAFRIETTPSMSVHEELTSIKRFYQKWANQTGFSAANSWSKSSSSTFARFFPNGETDSDHATISELEVSLSVDQDGIRGLLVIRLKNKFRQSGP